MNYTNYTNTETSSKSLGMMTLDEQKEFMQHFTREFVEKHKQSYLFQGVIAELEKGTDPYSIIQQLIEHLQVLTRKGCEPFQ